MRWFGIGSGSGGGESDAARARREASEKSMAAGGLPLDAIDRLEHQRGKQGTPAHLFSSDLSASELALVREAGFTPLGQVMGSSVYHIGWQFMPSRGGGWAGWSGQSSELSTLTAAYYQARHLALNRLRQEAAMLGATAVVGVRLTRQAYDWGADLLEFAAIGTAIRETDVEPALALGDQVALSDLSGQEFWLLRQAGYRPCGIAVGNCSYYQVPTWSTQRATGGSGFFGSWANQELPDYTQALYNARGLAMERMDLEGRAAGAEGVVGVTMEIEVTPREVEDSNNDNNKRIDMLYHFTAVGTAIAAFPAPGSAISPRPVVDLG